MRQATNNDFKTVLCESGVQKEVVGMSKGQQNSNKIKKDQIRSAEVRRSQMR